jgi:hypothetical protein
MLSETQRSTVWSGWPLQYEIEIIDHVSAGQAAPVVLSCPQFRDRCRPCRSSTALYKSHELAKPSGLTMKSAFSDTVATEVDANSLSAIDHVYQADPMGLKVIPRQPRPKDPKFQVCLLDGCWAILATWKNGHARQVNGFPSKEIALEWIEKASGNWLRNQERLISRPWTYLRHMNCDENAKQMITDFGDDACERLRVAAKQARKRGDRKLARQYTQIMGRIVELTRGRS